MHARFFIFAVVLVVSLSLPLEGAYRLIFEWQGDAHTIEGIDESKPYYIKDGKQRFIHAAGRIRVKSGPDASPLDFFYPIDYGIEKLAPIREAAGRPSRYSVSFRLRGFRGAQVRYFDPKRLLTLWPREKIEEGILALFWTSSGNLEFLDMTQMVAMGKPESINHTLSSTFRREFPTGYPAVGLFVGGVSIPPRHAVQDPRDLSSVVAAYGGTIERTVERAESDRLLTFRDPEGNSLLHYAAVNGHHEALKNLLKSGLEPDLRNAEGATPLILAAERGRTACVDVLLSSGAKIRTLDKYEGNALHYAIRFGHEDVTSLLLEAGFSANRLGFEGHHPITLAINHDRGRILEKLVSAKGRWNRDRQAKNRVLISKSEVGEKRLVRYLISRGARANRLELGTTALIAATRYADEEMLEMLLEAGADVNQTNEKGISPLLRASQWGNEVAVEWLLEHGADVNQTAANGDSALSTASLYHNAGVVRLLLAHGADPNLADWLGYTSLELAILHGDRSVVQDLIEAGAECDLTEKKALLLMKYAFRNNIPEFVEIALNDCLTRDFRFYNRFSPEWVAAYYGHEEILRIFDQGKSGRVEKEIAGPALTPASELTERPRLLSGMPVGYPQQLASRYGDQIVRVRFIIAEDGRALFPQIVSGDVPVLNRLAMDTVGSWKFEPLRVRGKPVLTQFVAPIEFKNRDSEKTVFELSELDRAPKRISAVRPEYPPKLKQRGVQGRVILRIVIDKKGNVIAAHGRGSTHPAFLKPSIDAVLKWKFEPGYKDGSPVMTRRIQPIAFRLHREGFSYE